MQRSQITEDGFQKIREVTGLADVMDIVHKFLNREVEQDQLRGSVKDSEVRLEALRQDYDAFKRDTEGITFDSGGASRSGEIYKEIEQSERDLNDAMEEHELCRVRLQKTTLQVEHMKRWSARVGHFFKDLEDVTDIKVPADLKPFFGRLTDVVEKFVGQVDQQIKDSKITRSALVQVIAREYSDQDRLMKNEQFLRANCRVPATADGRPASRQGSAEDDPATSFAEERDRCKKDSEDMAKVEVDAMKKAEALKKRMRDK
jgi:hypothetical protein